MKSSPTLSRSLVGALALALVGVVSNAQADPAFEEITAAAGKYPASATTLYAIGPVPITVSPGGVEIGTLSPTSQVQVLGSEGDWLKVKITGWQQGKGGRLVFFAPGRRILVAQLKPEERGRLVHGASQTDPATDQQWTATSLEGYVPRAKFVDNNQVLWKYGEVLVNKNCTSCHPRPELDHFTANQWAGIVRSKKSRVNADAEQLQFLTQYTQKHASDMKPN